MEIGLLSVGGRTDEPYGPPSFKARLCRADLKDVILLQLACEGNVRRESIGGSRWWGNESPSSLARFSHHTLAARMSILLLSGTAGALPIFGKQYGSASLRRRCQNVERKRSTEVG